MIEEKELYLNEPLPIGGDGLDELRGVLFAHVNRYPLMDIQDAAKLIYQHEFGCAHLIKDAGAAYSNFINEYNGVVQKPLPLLESVGGGYARLDLRALAANNVAPVEAFDWVIKTASQSVGSLAGFIKKLDLLKEPWLGFDPERVKSFFAYYKNSGYSPLRHSARYVAAYAPAYRVIRAELAKGRQLIQDHKE